MGPISRAAIEIQGKIVLYSVRSVRSVYRNRSRDDAILESAGKPSPGPDAYGLETLV